MEANDLSLTEFLAPYREKITETWAEVLASDEVQIGRWVATGDLLNDAKAAGLKAGKKWMTDVFPLLCPGSKPFGLGKAEKLMDIAGTPELRDSSNWKNLPAHISTLYALSKVDERVGQGSLARWTAGELLGGGKKAPMHPDLEKAQVDAIVEHVIRDQEPLSAGWNELLARDLGVAPDEAKKIRAGAKPRSSAKPPSAKLSPDEWDTTAPWKGYEREVEKFIHVLEYAVMHWVPRCPDNPDQLSVPEKKLAKIADGERDVTLRDWYRAAWRARAEAAP